MGIFDNDFCLYRMAGRLFAQLPLIPLIKTDYVIDQTAQTLEEGIVLKQIDGVVVKIEVPSYFQEDNQCFDFWFLPDYGNHSLTVKDFSMTAFSHNQSEIKKEKSYLFWEDGSQAEVFDIENHQLKKVENDYFGDSYVFMRTVFDVSKERDFSVKIKSSFVINDQPHLIDTTLSIKKTHKLTWSRLRFH